MAVPTCSANRIAPCYVTFGSDWIEVESIKTGKSMRLDLGPCSDISWLSSEEQSFLKKLTYSPDADSEVELTFKQLDLYKSCVEKVAARKQQAQQRVEEEIALPAEVDDKIRKLYDICKRLKRTAFDKRPLFRISWYVPTRVSNPTSKGGRGMFANNATRVKALGMVEFDGSNYYGFEDSKPQDLIDEMEAWNALPEVAATEFLPKHMRLMVKCDWNEVHPREMEKRRDEAFCALRDNLVSVQLALMDKVKNAEDTLKETLAELDKQSGKATNKQLEAAHKRRVQNTYSAIYTAKTEMDNAIKSAAMFDETEALEPLFDGLKDAIKSSNAALVAAKRAAKQY
jgi:hypothetical protein